LKRTLNQQRATKYKLSKHQGRRRDDKNRSLPESHSFPLVHTLFQEEQSQFSATINERRIRTRKEMTRDLANKKH
jgi:hypothetical protein